MTPATEIAPVIKTVEVDASPEHAFEVFTQRLDSWWPKLSHSIGEERVDVIDVEPRHGGRILERWRDGTEYEWGRFIDWDPPHRFVMEWRPRPDPGPKTEVEVTFTRHGDRTVVELRHRGWERLGDSAGTARADYDTGWVRVLELYQRAA